MGAITILSITTFIFLTFSLIVIFFSFKDKLNEITKDKKIVFIFLEIVFFSLINNIKLVDGINNYKKNKLSIEENKIEANSNAKEKISSLSTEFEDTRTLFSNNTKNTFYFKNTSLIKNEENDEIS